MNQTFNSRGSARQLISQSQNFMKPPQPQTQATTAEQTLSVSADYSEAGKASIRPCSTQSKSLVIMNKEMQDKTVMLKQIEKQLKSQLDLIPNSFKGTVQEQITKVRDDVRKLQKELHQVVSSGSKQVTLATGQPTQVEITSMNTAIVKVITEDHKGPLQLQIEFTPRNEGDLQCHGYISKKV